MLTDRAGIFCVIYKAVVETVLFTNSVTYAGHCVSLVVSPSFSCAIDRAYLQILVVAWLFSENLLGDKEIYCYY